MIPLDGEAGDPPEQVRFGAVARQMFDCLVHEKARLLPRALLAQQRHEGRLARMRILAGALARSRFVAAVLDEGVANLEGEPDVPGIAPIGCARFGWKLGHDARRL